MDARRRRHVLDRIVERAGGPARLREILALACVLGLQGADTGAMGAMAERLQESLSISKTHIGVILACSLIAGAVGSLPFGWLVDRVNRTRMLSWAIFAWAVAMVLSACSTGFFFLLLSQLL